MDKPRLIEWDSLAMRVRGDRLAQLAGEAIRAKKAPITALSFEFLPGEMKIEGKATKGISIPFRVSIRRILPAGQRVEVHLDNVSAFGLPVPTILKRLAEPFVKDEVVQFDADASKLSIALDRFLPEFVDVKIDSIEVIRGGILIRLGPGGADPPVEIPGGM